MRKTGILLGLVLLWCSPVPAIVISEVMYHPQADETLYEWVELYNETSTRRDLSGWVFKEGIDYRFPEGTVMEPDSYLVVAVNPLALRRQYDIPNLFGPFGGRLDNDSDHVILRDNAGGIIAEVDYSDGGKWPVAADGAGHSLSKVNLRGDPMDPDNWAASELIGGSPGRANGSEPWYETTVLIEEGDTWRYFKGTSEASNPTDAWRQVGFDDSSWLSGPTGIGYGGGDDATVLSDMQGNYVSVFCRKTFALSDPSTIDRLILDVDHDDGFIAYLNGAEMGRGAYSLLMPSTYNTVAFNHPATVDGGSLTVLNLTPYRHLLGATNVLAIQVHNSSLFGDDLSLIPRLKAQTLRLPQQLNMPVVLNEILFNTSDTQYIELYNRSASPVDVGNYCLSNDPDNLQRFVIPSPTVVPGHGRVVFIQSQLGFSMTAAGDRVLFSDGASGIVIDGRAVEPGPRDMSEGRWPDGASDWYYMDQTASAPNQVALNQSVVINEFMYHPPTDDERDEYIELYNAGAAMVDLTGWRFSRGVQFTFPIGASINPGQYLVIAKNRQRMITRYGLSPFIVLGDYTGGLSDSGEKIRLRDANNNVADEVVYSDGGHWSEWSDGYGSSLELIDPRQDNSNYQAWGPSDETGKTQWQFYSYQAVNTMPYNTEQQEIHIHLMGPGVVMLDDVRVERSGVDYFANGGFESGTTSWVIMGNHVQSGSTTEDAHGGSRCLKIIATGRGDTGANHIEQDAARLMPTGQTFTISFWAKWQWGNRVLITRGYDNKMAKSHMLPIPDKTGTPGARNSVYQANLGPVHSEVIHSPVIPSSASPVTVTARVHDPDGVVTAVLYHKADSEGSYSQTTLYDDGAHGDGQAGDGVYGGTLPARSAGQTVAFYIRSVDGQAAVNTWPTDPSRPALYRVETAPLSSTFPTYRIIMTSQDAAELDSRPCLSNEQLNCTFVFEEKDVYYNCGVRYIGSPFHRGHNNPTGYKVSFNADEKLHGIKRQARVDTNHGGAYRDRISYDLQRWMGLPHCELQWAMVRVNERTRGVLEDTLPPGRRYIDRFYRGDDDGYLFEVDDRFRFTSTNDLDFSSFNNYNAEFGWLGYDKELYRHNYEVRNHDNEDDYTSIIALMNVLNNTPLAQYEQAVTEMIDIHSWFRLFAVRACLADWDFIAFRRGKNCYLYWPLEKGQWELFGWDSELTFQPSNVSMSIWSNFTPIRNLQQHPVFRHWYFSYLQEMLDKHFTTAKLGPWLDHYASLVGGNATQDRQFIIDRSAYLQSQIPNATVRITTNGGNPITVDELRVELEGTAPVHARWARANHRLYFLGWTGPTTWKQTFALYHGEQELFIEFLDYDGNVIGIATIQIRAPDSTGAKNWHLY